MRKSIKALIAGGVALVCAGGVYAAAQDVHVLKVALPDGSVAQIHYVGDVAPRVVVAPAAMPVAMVDPDPGSPFAMVDRIAAEMDRQQAAILQQVAAMQAATAADGARVAQTGGAQPQDVYHYSYVATSSGPGGCTQSYALTSYGGGKAPEQVSKQSGDCRGVAPLMKTVAPAAASAAPKLTAATPATPTRISPDSI